MSREDLLSLKIQKTILSCISLSFFDHVGWTKRKIKHDMPYTVKQKEHGSLSFATSISEYIECYNSKASSTELKEAE